MKQKHTTWHGAELTPVAIKAGFVDYFAAAEAVDAEYYDINAEDEGTWELVNGDELYFRDSEGEGYSSEMALERVRELEAMIAGAEENQDTSRWEKDIELLTARCEVIEPCEYYQVPEEGARILLDESEELVYYNARLEVYVWGICHLGLNWKRVLTTIPVR